MDLLRFFFFVSAGKEKLSERKKTSSQLTHNALHCRSLPAGMQTHSKGTLRVLGRILPFVCPSSLPNSTLFWKQGGNNQGDDANNNEAPHCSTARGVRHPAAPGVEREE